MIVFVVVFFHRKPNICRLTKVDFCLLCCEAWHLFPKAPEVFRRPDPTRRWDRERHKTGETREIEIGVSTLWKTDKDREINFAMCGTGGSE